MRKISKLDYEILMRKLWNNEISENDKDACSHACAMWAANEKIENYIYNIIKKYI